MPRKTLLLITLAALLGACGLRPGPDVLLPVPQPDNTAQRVSIIVATNREPDPMTPGNFGNGRAEGLSFGRYTISIPPIHRPNNIEYSTKRPVDPTNSFAVLAFEPLPRGFAELAAAEDNGVDGAEYNGKVFVFVHGYNTNYAEAVFRMAQLMADNPVHGGRAILFAWPSDGSLPGYVADKDAVTYSRDQLARLLTSLSEDPRNREITLAAHSMGCWLAMEALRQLRISGNGAVLDRLDNILLAAPDIDLDVFRAQVKAVGRLDPPITVLASPDDRALSFSFLLGGDRERVGGLDVRDPRIQELASVHGIQIIDISSMAATDSLHHDRYIGAAASLRTMIKPKSAENPFRRAGAFVMDAMATVLETPGRLGRAAAEATK